MKWNQQVKKKEKAIHYVFCLGMFNLAPEKQSYDLGVVGGGGERARRL